MKGFLKKLSKFYRIRSNFTKYKKSCESTVSTSSIQSKTTDTKDKIAFDQIPRLEFIYFDSIPFD